MPERSRGNSAPLSGSGPPSSWTWRRLLAARIPEWRAWWGQTHDLRIWFPYLPGPGPMLMSWLRRRWLLFRHPHCEIVFDGPVYLGPRFSLHAPHGGRFIVGPGVEFRRGFRAELNDRQASITIGAMTAFTYDVTIQCTTSIAIGCHCVLAQGALLVDGNHRYFEDLETPPMQQGWQYRPLSLGDYVTVLSKSTVLNHIGTRTVVGANAVVAAAMPPFCVVGGVPARVISWHGPPGSEPPPELKRVSPAP